MNIKELKYPIKKEDIEIINIDNLKINKTMYENNYKDNFKFEKEEPDLEL